MAEIKPVQPSKPVEVPKVDAYEVSVEKRKKEAEEVLNKARTILAQYKNLESQVPPGNEYWMLMNQYRALTSY